MMSWQASLRHAHASQGGAHQRGRRPFLLPSRHEICHFVIHTPFGTEYDTPTIVTKQNNQIKP